MLFDSRVFRGHTVVAVLVSFGWMSIGGPIWAESRSADRDPERFLARLVDDPRLATFPELRERVQGLLAEREGVEVLATTEPGSAVDLGSIDLGWSGTRGHGERRAAAEMGAIADRLELGLLEKSGRNLVARIDGGSAGEGEAGLDLDALERLLSLMEGRATVELDAAALETILNDTRHRLLSAHHRALEGFDATGSRLRKSDLPASVLARHEAATESYRQSMEIVLEELALAAALGDPEAHRSALEFVAEALAGTGDTGPSRALDPSRMPFDRAVSAERQPGAFYGDRVAPIRAGNEKALAPPTADDLAATEDAPMRR